MNKRLQRSLQGMMLSLSLLSIAACGAAQEPEPVADAVEDVAEADLSNAADDSAADDSMDGANEAGSETEADADAAAGDDSAAAPVAAAQGCAAFDTDERFLPVADLVAAIEDPDCAAGQNVTFVDARPQLDYEFGHIPGAINVPYFNAAAYVDDLPRDSWLVIYCECPHAEAVQAADTLTSEEHGFTMVKVIDEGLGGWRDLGREIVADEASTSG